MSESSTPQPSLAPLASDFFQPGPSIGNFPLGSRQMAEHSLARRRTVAISGTRAYQGDGGRVGGQEPNGIDAVPSVLIQLPQEVRQAIHAGALEFLSRLPEQYRSFVEVYPVDHLHITVTHDKVWTPKSDQSLHDTVREGIEDLGRAVRSLRPFFMRGQGFESLDGVGIWRVFLGAEAVTYAKAHFMKSGVRGFDQGVSPFTSPIAPKIDERWGQTAHCTPWIYSGHIPGEVIAEAMAGMRIEAKGTFRVDEFTVEANVHQGGTFYSTERLATLELGSGIKENTVGLPNAAPTGIAQTL